MADSIEEIVGAIEAFRRITAEAWPDLAESLAERSASWQFADEPRLRADWQDYLSELAKPPREIRVFWKLGDELVYRGCNLPFARDGGFQAISEMVGVTDFDPRVPWTRQAAKYQSDDREAMANGAPMPYILERQEREDGVHWLHTGKAPILSKSGAAIGLLGIYETIDAKRALELRRHTDQL